VKTVGNKQTETFYASIVRYDKTLGEGKQVLNWELGDTAQQAIDNVIWSWKKGKRNPNRLPQS
jgi:hypothetical protein